jgi:hypothetical protein
MLYIKHLCLTIASSWSRAVYLDELLFNIWDMCVQIAAMFVVSYCKIYLFFKLLLIALGTN